MKRNQEAFRFLPRQRPFEDDPAWDAFLEQFTLKNPHLDSYRNAYFLLENGLGDQVCVLGLLKSFKAAYNVSNIILIANERSKDIIECFDSYDAVLWYKDRPPSLKPSCGRIFNVLHRPSKSYVYYGQLQPVFSSFQIPYIDQYRIGMYLPLSSKYNPPKAVPIRHSSLLGDADPSKVVILFPYANTIDPPSFTFWTGLAHQLNSAGFTCFTNVVNKHAGSSPLSGLSADNNLAIPGTFSLHCSVRELLALGHVVAAGIMTNSGPAWLLAHAPIRKIILHQSRVYELSRFRQTCLGDSQVVSNIQLDSFRKNFPDQPFEEYEFDYLHEDGYLSIAASIAQTLLRN